MQHNGASVILSKPKLDSHATVCYNRYVKGGDNVKFMLDFSEELRTKVKVKAAEQKTSMNDLIIKAIQMYLAAKKGE